MPDPLSYLWPHVDAAEPLFFKYAFAAWKDADFDGLIAAGFLQPAGTADTIPCPSCAEGHVEEVFQWQNPQGSSRFYIPCPEVLRVEIPPKLLRQWTIDFDFLACTIAQSLSLTGQCTELMQGRLWRLGRTKWQGVSRDVVLARGLGWSDGRGVTSQVAHTIRPVVFVADRLPQSALWLGRIPPVIALSQVATLGEDGLVVDQDAVCAAIIEVDLQRGADASTTLGPAQLKLMIRQQVKAEEKSRLTDDILLAAYQQEGSVRKAAAFLSKQTNQVVTKDKVQAALTRAGGATNVVRQDDSHSVVRTVASQRRDRSGKTLRKPDLVEDQ